MRFLARAISICLFAASLGGCAVLFYPDQQEARTFTRVETVDDARAYISVVRTSMMNTRYALGGVEAAGDALTAGGTITSVLGGALHWASNTVIRAAVVAGSGVALNQALDPRTQAKILDAGISELNCIDTAAEDSYPAALQVDQILGPVLVGRDTAQAIWQAADAAVGSARKDLTDSGLPSEQITALGKQIDALNDRLMASGDEIKFANDFATERQPRVYQRVRTTVNAVIAATNEQLLNAVADPSTFAAALQKISASPPAATGPSSSRAPAVTSSSPQPPETAPIGLTSDQQTQYEKMVHELSHLQDEIDNVETEARALQSIVQQAMDRLAPLGSAATPDFSACIPGAVVLAPSTNGPIVLTVGTAFGFTVSGGSHGSGWEGPVPANINVNRPASNQDATQYELTATAGTPAGPFMMVFTPSTKGPQLKISVSVKAADH